MRIIAILLLMSLSGCSLFQKPCRNVNRLVKKHSQCFEQLTKQIIINDTFNYTDTIYTENKEYIFTFETDTIYEDKYLYFEKRGAEYKVNCKGDTIYINDTIVRMLFKDVPILQPKPQGFSWKPVVVSIVLLVLLILGLITIGKYLDYKKEKDFNDRMKKFNRH